MRQNNSKEADTKRRIPVIGVTGGVGSGKSVVMELLEKEFGAGVILADLVAHDLMEPGAVSYRQIVAEFGTEILDGERRIDRPALSRIVFGHPEQLQRLNAITHPNVKQEILSRIARFREEGNVSVIALEAALLIESGYEEILDELWYVYVSEEIRIRRLMEGRRYTEEKSRSIMAQQLGEEAFRSHCSRIIDNNGDVESLREQLVKIFCEEGLRAVSFDV